MPKTTPSLGPVKPAAARTAAEQEPTGTWRRTTIAEFLDLDESTMRLIDLKISLVRAIIRLRKEANLTQAALAKRAGMARPRIAEVEASRPQTSFDTILPVYFAVGGTSAEFADLVRATDQSMTY